MKSYTGAISLDRISYRYSLFSENAVSDVQLKISSNEKIAIVGASGSGKSTLLKLMSCLYNFLIINSFMQIPKIYNVIVIVIKKI
ncbi:ATP-binding cassette domain-containing protein [Enterococcus faecium]|nr:ATP-binding cassette domain-containing protein [Enterococcus faecium]EME8081852.1 ATP-binding cassette domain-containing protein [Enterococcus faecium]